MAILVIKDKEFFVSYESDYIACKSGLPHVQIGLDIYYWFYIKRTLKGIKYCEWYVK